GQPPCDLVEQLVQLLILQRADRHDGIVGMLRHDPGHKGKQLVAPLQRVDLADHQDGAAGIRQQRQQLGVAVGPLAGFDHMHDHVHFGQRLRHDPVHHAIHGAAMAGLKARRVDEHELLVLARQHAVDAMPRGLRLARHNGNFRPDQGVGQGGFAHVGAPDHGDEPGSERGIAHLTSWATATGSDNCAVLRALPGLRVARAGLAAWAASSASLAADCSAARRLAPGATTFISSAGMAHSTSNCWLCAAPCVATTVYCGSASLRPCRNSCSRVLASLPSVRGSTLASTGWYCRTMTLRAASKPPSRKAAPKIASTASARMDGRRKPPLFSSPSPRRRCWDNSRRWPISASDACLTRLARRRDRSPSSSLGKRSYSMAATTKFSTESPRNSRRSLWRAL